MRKEKPIKIDELKKAILKVVIIKFQENLMLKKRDTKYEKEIEIKLAIIKSK